MFQVSYDGVSINKERAIQARKRKAEAKTVYLLNKLHIESIVTAQSQNLAIFDTLIPQCVRPELNTESLHGYQNTQAILLPEK